METQIDIIPDRFARRGEIKNLIVAEMKKQLPEFRLLTHSTGVQYFQRSREYLGHELHEVFHIVPSYNDARIACSVSSRLNEIHALSPLYDQGFINPHVDISSLRNGGSMVEEQLAWYRHKGTLDSVIKSIAIVVYDCRTVGIPWLDRRWSALHTERLVRFGIHAIELWDHDTTMLKNELELQLRKAKGIPTAIRHPVFNELKNQLIKVAGRPMYDKEKVERLTFDLLELYCRKKIAC